MKVKYLDRIVDAIPLATYTVEETDYIEKGLFIKRTKEIVKRIKYALVFIAWKYELKEIVEIPYENLIDELPLCDDWVYKEYFISKPNVKCEWTPESKIIDFNGYGFILENPEFIVNIYFDEKKSYELLYKVMPELLCLNNEDTLSFDECIITDNKIVSSDYFSIDVPKMFDKAKRYNKKFNEICENCHCKISDIDGIAYISSNMKFFVCPNCFKKITSSYNVKCLELDFLTTFEKFSYTGYHEFVKGKCNNFGNWETNSLYLDDNLLEENQNDSIYNLLNQSIDKYDQFGISYVDATAWEKMKKISQNGSDDVKKFILELNDFAEDAISNQGIFTILGI